MTVDIGINVDFAHVGDPGCDPETISSCGTKWTRILLRPDTPVDMLTALKDAGVKLLGLFTEESRTPDLTWNGVVAYYLNRGILRLLDALQVGNEPDGQSNTESSSEDPEAFLARIAEVREALVFRGVIIPLIAGGMASGNPDWFDPIWGRLWPLIDAVAIHPYGQRPNSDYPSPAWGFGRVVDLIQIYYTKLQMPIVVTEFGGSVTDFNSEHERATYISEMITTFYGLDDTIMPSAHLFCLLKTMQSNYGLLEADGSMTESWAAYCNSFPA